MGFIARLYNLVNGLAAEWLGRREHRNPEAVYEAAIQERVEQYQGLRQAAAGVLYMRGKLGKEQEVALRQLRRLDGELEGAVDNDDDGVALSLLRRREALRAECERVTNELRDLTNEAETAKKNLIAFRSDITQLREEKVRMLARLANAKARMRLQHRLGELSPDADLRALEQVRDHIERLSSEVQVGRELGDSELEQRLGDIREEQATASARAQLEELKRSRHRRLVSLPLPEPNGAGI
jgi:phage shock protein A